MIAASISFSGLDLLWAMCAVAGFLIIAVAAAYWRSPARAAVKAGCAALKVLGILALVGCLLEPVWSRSRAKPGANFFAVVTDNSQGLQIRDAGSSETRGALMKKRLTADGWRETLADTFTVKQYSFDTRLQAIENFEVLDFGGAGSALGGSLRALAERFRGQPLAGALLFTDGNATDIKDAFDTAGLPPIFPVVIGAKEPPRDISVQRVSVSQSAFEDAPVAIQAEISALGCKGEEVVLQLLNQKGEKVAEEMQKADRSDSTLAFRLTARPASHGISFFTLRAAPRFNTATNDAASREATLANNTSQIAVNRGRSDYRILYVAGRPNWEFKFLNRALAEETELQLVGLLRIARREPKFEFMGRRGESGNPLFRGFDRSDEEAERYDQPVLVRLNTRDELELKGGFPKVPEDLFSYDAVILDDLEAEFFTRDQMMLLQRFVSERGGGLLMLGGAESFREGGYARTPIGDMLPVYLEHSGEPPTGQLKIAYTSEGLLQPWLRLRDNEGDERARLAALPRFDILNPGREVKPGASVLATVELGRSTQPALVSQRFGHGRTGAMLIGDIWHWGLKDESLRRDMEKAWRQTMRWLVSDVPAPVQLHAAPVAGEQGLSLQVVARNKKFEPVDNARVTISVAPAAGATATNTLQLLAEEVAASPGTYSATFIPRQPGGYRAEAVVLDENGVEIGRAEAGWASDPAADEFRTLKPNRPLLEQLATKTGGEVVDIDDLERFARSLPNRKAPITETVSSPLWHTPGMFALALLCFVGEWGLRRWKGLP